MMHPSKTLQAVLFSMLLVLVNPTSAIDVYKWVDVKGGIHYSQIPPDNQPAGIKKVTLPVTRPEPVEQASLQQTLDIARQLEISRLERERLRLEKRKVHIKRLQALQAEQASRGDSRLSYGVPIYYRPFFGYPHKPHHHRPHPYKPHKPHPYKPRPGHTQGVQPVTSPPRPGMHGVNHAYMSKLR